MSRKYDAEELERMGNLALKSVLRDDPTWSLVTGVSAERMFGVTGLFFVALVKPDARGPGLWLESSTEVWVSYELPGTDLEVAELVGRRSALCLPEALAALATGSYEHVNDVLRLKASGASMDLHLYSS